MERHAAAAPDTEQEALDFVRFCYHRRRVGWPELYDEMCAVAARGRYRGYGTDELAGLGIGFGLFDMPSLAAIARRVIDEEQALRRPVAVRIVPTTDDGRVADGDVDATPASVGHLATVTAGA